MFIKRVKHYHQWLRSAIHFKTESDQIPSNSVTIQGASKRPSSGLLYPVSSFKEHNRKGGKCKISRVLQSPVSSPKASPKVEASNRLKQAQHFSTSRKVQNENCRVHLDLPDSRGIGNIDRIIRHLPSHPHPPKLKEITKRFCYRSQVFTSLMPLFHQRIKPRSCRRPLIGGKKAKMGGNTESVLKSGIKYRSASGSLRTPQVAADRPRLVWD